MIQGSPEWLKLRKSYIGASDAPIIMGVSPWKTAAQLWKEKIGLPTEDKMNGAMLYGKQTESTALQAFIVETGIEMAPKVLFHPTISYLMASMDGLSKDGKKAVEIKCPGKKDHQVALDVNIPKKYYPQLQHQIEVAGIDEIYYYSYTPTSTALIIVKRDDQYIAEMLRLEREFWHCVENFIEIEADDGRALHSTRSLRS